MTGHVVSPLLARVLPRMFVPPARLPVVQPSPTWDASLPMAPQIAEWTCSACALDWVLRATGLDPTSTRDQVVYAIGYPQNINETYGLMDASGSALRAVYESYGQSTAQAWLGFDALYELARGTTGQISGTAWYHWVALRGVQGGAIWIANSAPGYMGVYDLLDRADVERLGPFSVVGLG